MPLLTKIKWFSEGEHRPVSGGFEATLFFEKERTPQDEYPFVVTITVMYNSSPKDEEPIQKIRFKTLPEAVAFFSNLKNSVSAENS